MSQAKFNNKTLAREYAFKFVYKLFLDHFNEEKNEIISDTKKLEDLIIEFDESYAKEDEEHLDNELNPQIQKYGKKLINGFLANESDIISKINNFLKKGFNDTQDIEKTILVLGCYEITNEDTPNKVVINEYVNLSKKYGNKETSGLVNGVLDNLNKSL